MKILIILMIMVSSDVFGKIPGVPHGLRRHFKSSHKFKEISVPYKKAVLKMRKAPGSDRVVLIYDIPSVINENKLIEKFVLTKLDKNYSLNLLRRENQVSEYGVFYKRTIIENAYVKFYQADDKRIAMGLNLPHQNLVPIRFPNSHEQNLPLALLEGKLVEKRLQIKREDAVGENLEKRLETFPESSELSEKNVKELMDREAVNGTLEKIEIPEGTFPDQIQADSYGHIWFTQPFDSLLTSFDPDQKSWFHKKVGAGVDGIYVDRDDRVWFGEYRDEHLGLYDIATDDYKRFALPYEGSKPAIPYFANNGTIWLTDHRNNKVLSFDENTKKFEVYPVPTTGAWPVDIREDKKTGDIYVSECYANKFGKISKNENGENIYSEVSLSVDGCPAFLTITDNKIWSGLWSDPVIISYDLDTREVTEYKIKNDSGFGPIAHTQEGKIVFGSLTSGKVYQFDPKTEELIYVKGVGQLKDGLTIDQLGNVWVTERGPYIYKIHF